MRQQAPVWHAILRVPAVLLALAMALGGACAGGEEAATTVNTGDTVSDVAAKLGKPQGSITRGHLTTYYYDRGMVDFVDGRVTRAALISPAEAEQQRIARERAAAAAQERNAAERQRLTAEGQREQARAQADPALQGRPAADRLAFWQDFARRYPYTDAKADIERAQAGADAESSLQKQGAAIRESRDRIDAIQSRLLQLDADYAASLANWKRHEIEVERAKLKAELNTLVKDVLKKQGEARATAAAGPQ